MSNTEIRFLEGPDGQTMFYLDHAPLAAKVRRSMKVFPYAQAQAAITALAAYPLGLDAVKSAGIHLRAALAQHADIEKALSAAFLAPVGNSFPLCLAIDSPEASALPWESLFDAGAGFVALDSRWPIARASDPVTPTRSGERLLEFPVRFAFVLSAGGRDALPEWKAIYRALEKSPVDFRATVFTSQSAVDQAIAAVGDNRFEARPVGGKANLLDALDVLAPHFLHFYCHGSEEFSPHLLIATATDQQMVPAGLGFALETNELSGVKGLMDTVWVVTLNACLGAATPQIGLSLAQSLADAGPPAVIGMREIVATDDAHEFSRRFYGAVVDRLYMCRQSAVQPVELHWSELVWPARTAILARHEKGKPSTVAAEGCKEWTLPVTYARREPFMLRSVPASPLSTDEREELMAELSTLGTHRQTLAAGTPEAILEMIDDRMKAIRQQLGS